MLVTRHSAATLGEVITLISIQSMLINSLGGWGWSKQAPGGIGVKVGASSVTVECSRTQQPSHN